MVQAAIPKTVTTPASWLRIGSLNELMLLLLLVVMVLLALYGMNPPNSVPVNAPLSEFSSGRAMQHLKVLSTNSRPIGSAHHNRVGDYIFAGLASMGLSPEIQQASIVQQVERGFVVGASLHNIVARLKGTEPGAGRALMLIAHYDSKQSSFGASDDGAAIAAILETLRALKAGAPLKNDVILLFTDGEEIGLLGAKAFVEEHPWAKDVGLVLNFEARGTSGPVMMFETSTGNRNLIDGLAHAAPYPVANSLMYEIYRLLPNDTDLTVFKKSQIPGMNFAFINEPSRYHTPLDNLKNLDERSLQHHGSYALALTRYFGNHNLNVRSGRDAVYFDLFGLTLVHYPAVLVLPLTALVVISFVAVACYGLRKRIASLTGIVVGFLAFLVSLIVGPGIVALVWWLIRSLRGDYAAMPRGDIYHSEFYALGFAALSIAIFSALCILFDKKLGVHNRALGALLGGLILLLASSFFLPGSSYLLVWPMLGSLIALALIFASAGEESRSTKRMALLTLGAIPAVVLFVPMIYILFAALSLDLASASTVLLVLLLGLLIPQLSYLSARSKWLLPTAMVTIGLCCITLGLAYSGFSASQPRPDNIFYGLNADRQEAIWASTDASPDQWTKQFLTANPQHSPLEDYFPGTPRPFLNSQADVVALPAPEIKVLNDSAQENRRIVHVRVTSIRQAPLISVYCEPDTEIREIVINGKRTALEQGSVTASAKAPWVMRYYALPAEGLELVLELQPQAQVKLKVVDQSYELPALPNFSVTARPENLMPSSAPWGDATFVSKSFVF